MKRKMKQKWREREARTCFFSFLSFSHESSEWRAFLCLKKKILEFNAFRLTKTSTSTSPPPRTKKKNTRAPAPPPLSFPLSPLPPPLLRNVKGKERALIRKRPPHPPTHKKSFYKTFFLKLFSLLPGRVVNSPLSLLSAASLSPSSIPGNKKKGAKRRRKGKHKAE